MINLKNKKPSTGSYDHVSCSCGKHFGIGMWTAEHRARVYAWFRDVYKNGFTAPHREFLESYQKAHGYQYPNILPK